MRGFKKVTVGLDDDNDLVVDVGGRFRKLLSSFVGGDDNGGSQPFQSAKVTLTNDQVLALVSTPVEVVAAPGAGKIVYPISAFMVIKNAAAEYTNLDAQAVLGLRVVSVNCDMCTPYDEAANGALGTAATPGGGSFVPFIVPAVTASELSSPITGEWQAQASQIENEPLSLFGYNASSGDFTGGDDANTLDVYVTYQIADVS